MFLPKFAIHASPYKLSHFAARSQQHFQHLRNSLNLGNLGSTAGGSSTGASQSAGGGLGAAASGSGAGSGATGAGGAKWHAGSRAGNWGYQTHGRLVAQSNSASSDAGGRADDDDQQQQQYQKPSLAFHSHSIFLRSVRLQREREAALASRWAEASSSTGVLIKRRSRSSSTPGSATDEKADGEAQLQSVYRSAFQPESNQASSSSDSDSQLTPVPEVAAAVEPSRPTVRSASTSRSMPSQTSHSLSTYRRRRASVGDSSTLDPALFTRSVLTPHLRAASTLAEPPLSSSPASQDIEPSPDAQAVDKWLAQATRLASLRPLPSAHQVLGFLSSLPADAPSAALDSAIWLYAVTREFGSPVDVVLRKHKESGGSGTDVKEPRASALVYATARREAENRLRADKLAVQKEEEIIRAHLDSVRSHKARSIVGSPEQAAPAGEGTTAATMATTDAGFWLKEPNLTIASHIFSSSSLPLQPAALDSLLAACAARSAVLSTPSSKASVTSLAISVYSHLEATAQWTPGAYASLIEVFGNVGDLPGALEVYEDYLTHRRDSKLDRLSHVLVGPSGQSPTAAEDIGSWGAADEQVLEAYLGACFNASDSAAAASALEKALTAGAEMSPGLLRRLVLGFAETGDSDSALGWLRRAQEAGALDAAGRWKEVGGAMEGESGDAEAEAEEMIWQRRRFGWFTDLARSAARRGCSPVAVEAFQAAIARRPVGPPLSADSQACAETFGAVADRLLYDLLRADEPAELVRAFGGLVAGYAVGYLSAAVSSWRAQEIRALGTGLSELRRALGWCVEAGKLEWAEAVLRDETLRSSEAAGGWLEFMHSELLGLGGAGNGEKGRDPPAGWASRISRVVSERGGLSVEAALRLCQLHASQRGDTAAVVPFALQDADWGVLSKAAGIIHLQESATGPLAWTLEAFIKDFERRATAQEKEDAGFLIAAVTRVDGAEAAQTLAARLGVEQPPATQRADIAEEVDNYVRLGTEFFANRYNLLRLVGTEAPGANAAAEQSPPETDAAQSQSDEASSLFSSAPATQPSGATTPVSETLSVASGASRTQPLSFPHPPFRFISTKFSDWALRMYCSRDLGAVTKMWQAIQQSAQRGVYVTAEAGAALVETLGRHKRGDWAREAYVYAHVALSSAQMSAEKRSALWVRLEDRMIVALAYCGALGEVAVHKARLVEAGEAPSADAYAAMIQHAHETTDDANVALAYFEEANRLRVVPNTFLCNTIIAKLSKARRAPAALEVYAYMKHHRLSRNSVTYGAIINACCRTGDAASAESLFREMLSCPNYKPRIPPFNTMIQFYVNTQPNRERALYYYDQLLKQNVAPTEHTYNMLMQAFGFIEPVDPHSMRDVFERACVDPNIKINGSHWGTLINAQGCVQRDVDGAIAVFESIASHPSTQRSRSALPDAVCYEALFNVFLGVHRPDLIGGYAQRMKSEKVPTTAYVVNTLIKGHALQGDMDAARAVFESLLDPPPGHAAQSNHQTPSNTRSLSAALNRAANGKVYREPSSFEVMIRAELGCGEIERAEALVRRMEARAYPVALINRVRRLINPSEPMEAPILEHDTFLPWQSRSPVSFAALADAGSAQVSPSSLVA